MLKLCSAPEMMIHHIVGMPSTRRATDGERELHRDAVTAVRVGRRRGADRG